MTAISGYNPVVITGRVDTDGTILGGTGFTVVANGGGDYTITWPTMANLPLIQVSVEDATAQGFWANWYGLSTTGVGVFTWTGPATQGDMPFHLLVVTVS